MFTECLNQRFLASSRSMKNINNPEESKSLNFNEIQFELCSNFLKQAKENLYQQEVEILSFSEKILTNLKEKAVFSYEHLKNNLGSEDSTMFSFQTSESDIFNDSSSTLMLRKSRSTNCLRRTENDYSLILREIESRCSSRTNQTIKYLIEENKKLKEKMSNVDKKEKEFKKKLIEIEKEQEEILLLKKKNVDNEAIINSLNAEIGSLRMKLKEAEQLKRSKSPSHDFHFSQMIEIETSLKSFMNQKQQIILNSSKKLKGLYDEILKKIELPFSNENMSCLKCCEMFKRLKFSILKFREIMEVEANATDELHDKMKARLKKN